MQCIEKIVAMLNEETVCKIKELEMQKIEKTKKVLDELLKNGKSGLSDELERIINQRIQWVNGDAVFREKYKPYDWCIVCDKFISFLMYMPTYTLPREEYLTPSDILPFMISLDIPQIGLLNFHSHRGSPSELYFELQKEQHITGETPKEMMMTLNLKQETVLYYKIRKVSSPEKYMKYFVLPDEYDGNLKKAGEYFAFHKLKLTDPCKLRALVKSSDTSEYRLITGDPRLY